MIDRAGARSASASPRAAAAELWLSAWQHLIGRVGHDIRNPLNGASLNLEVVRARAAVPGTDPLALAPFAEAASSQLSAAVELVEALLTLARPGRAPIDLESVVRPLVRLYAALVGRGSGTGEDDGATHSGRITLVGESVAPSRVRVDADDARLLVSEALDAATTGEGPHIVTCAIGRDEGHVVVDVRFERPTTAALSPSLDGVARASGIRRERTPEGIKLLFPVA
ncbi:MAG: hypothetical protein M3068_01905 [Gemmatimonadota bacterium]|nr:hypothetical protein [Gemmatimonadota bacterium]